MATPVWQRKAGKSKSGGLNARGRASYNRATGGNLKAPVTTKPSKLKIPLSKICLSSEQRDITCNGQQWVQSNK